MKLEWTGRWFRIEVELFGPRLDLSNYSGYRRGESVDRKRRLWRQVRAKLKSEPSLAKRELRVT